MQRLTITGTIGGGNPYFTVSPTPLFLKLYWNPSLLNPFQDYTLNGADIAITNPAAIPQTGDSLTALGEVSAS